MSCSSTTSTLSHDSACNIAYRKNLQSLLVACERCHRYKEKCTFENLKDGCARCQAVGVQCCPRTRKRMGRRPKAQRMPHGSTSILALAELYEAPRSRSKTEYLNKQTGRTASQAATRANLCSSEWSLCPLVPPLCSSIQINHMLDTEEGFFKVHRTFIVGRSFIDGFQNTVRRLFARSFQLLADAYSIALKLLDARHAASPSLRSHDFTMGSRCLQKLMENSSHPTHLEDAAVTILLGQAMLVFNTLISSPSTHVITRGILLQVKPWYPALLQQSYLDAVTLTPVLMDTIECLIRRDVPVIKVAALNRCVVDRFLGVCTSLLPLLYELCELSSQSKSNDRRTCTAVQADSKSDQYTNIEQRIRDWGPELPPAFFTAYSSLETKVMLVQARCYRLAGLLVMHRLRFPLGVNDLEAQQYAETILRELSILKAWPSDAATGLGLDFPLLIASLELPEMGIEIYEAFKPFRFRSQHSDELVSFIQYVMTAKECGFDGLWFDLVHDRLHGITLT